MTETGLVGTQFGLSHPSSLALLSFTAPPFRLELGGGDVILKMGKMGLLQFGSSQSFIVLETCVPFAQGTATPGCHGNSSQWTPPEISAKTGNGPS